MATPTSYSTKLQSQRDPNQTLQFAFNDNDKSLSISSFVMSKVGAKVVRTIISATIDQYSFLDVVYTDSGTLNSTMDVTGLTGVLNNVAIGQVVFGTNIAAGTVVSALVSDTEITLNQNASGSGSSTLQFANLLYTLQITYDDASHDNVNIVERIA